MRRRLFVFGKNVMIRRLGHRSKQRPYFSNSGPWGPCLFGVPVWTDG